MRRMVPAAIAIVALSLTAAARAASQTVIAAADRVVRAQLHDPTSAIFRGVKASPRGDVCGEVDSRNIEGGRTGFARFIYIRRSGKTALALHDPDFRQFFTMDDNEYTNGNAKVITDDACSFVRSWVATCPLDMIRIERRAEGLCQLYNGGKKGRAHLKSLIGSR